MKKKLSFNPCSSFLTGYSCREVGSVLNEDLYSRLSEEAKGISVSHVFADTILLRLLAEFLL